MTQVRFTVEKEYLCRVRLLGEDGMEVPKTPLGKTYGAGFNGLTASTRLRLTSREASPESEIGNFHPGLSLNTPNELFQITKPGLYTLEMQFQFLVPTNPANVGFALARTPVVRMIVRNQ